MTVPFFSGNRITVTVSMITQGLPYKIARPQESQSFTAYTISKDENDFFFETLIHSIRPTRSHLARFARARFALRAHENFRKKKSVSQSTQNALKRIEMQKKFYPFARAA